MSGTRNARGAVALLAVLVLAAAIGCQSGHEDNQDGLSGFIRIKGSDTMVNLSQLWAERFMDLHPRAFVAVTGGGSGTGIAAIINGTTDIAQSSRPMRQEEIRAAERNKIEPKEFQVGLDGLAVVVNPGNPVDELTLDELRDIFMGTIRNWKGVGGRDGRIVILSRESNSGTHVYFKEHVLRRGREKGPEEFDPSALLMPSSQAIADEVASSPNAIGYYGLGYVTPRQKAVAVAPRSGEPGMLPSVETVQNGTYPIARPLLMYTRGEPSGLVEAFIDFIVGPEGQEIVVELDFVPITEADNK